jgi:hypothetical protein
MAGFAVHQTVDVSAHRRCKRTWRFFFESLVTSPSKAFYPWNLTPAYIFGPKRREYQIAGRFEPTAQVVGAIEPQQVTADQIHLPR